MIIEPEELETGKYRNVQCIYKIQNTYTGIAYVGSTTNLKSRIKNHIKRLNENKHHNLQLQYSWNKNKDNFIYELLEVVDDVTFLPYAELYYIEKYRRIKGVYNVNNPLDEIRVIAGRKKKDNTSTKNNKSSGNKKSNKPSHDEFKTYIEKEYKLFIDKLYDVIVNDSKIIKFNKIFNALHEAIKTNEPNNIFLNELERYFKWYLRKTFNASISSCSSKYIDNELLNKHNIVIDGEEYILLRDVYKTLYNREE